MIEGYRERDPRSDPDAWADEDGTVHPGNVTKLRRDGDAIELLDFLDLPEPEYDWAVPDLIERQDRIILTGEEGGGKSTLLRQLAVQLSSGIHPFGGDPFDPLSVLLLDVENSQRQVSRKIRPIAAQATQSYQRGRLHLAMRPGGIDLAGSREDYGWLSSQCQLAEPDVILGGPLYKLGSGDPNSEEQAKAVSGRFDQIRETFGCALVLETHSPHASNGGSRPIRPYGASLWMRWPEFGVFLDGLGDGSLKHWRGQRDEREWPAMLQRGGEWPWTPVARVRDVLWSRISDACIRAGAQLSQRELAKRLDTNQSAIRRAIDEHRGEWEAMQ